MGVFQNHLMAAAVAKAAESTDFYTYQIDQSCRLNGAEYLERTYSGSPTSTTTGTLSVWFKKSANGNADSMFTSGNGSGDKELNFRILDDNTMRLNIYDGSSQVGSIVSTDLFRDTSAWYHFLALWDTSQATASNRLKMYVNGTQVTNLSDSTYPSQDQESYMFADGRKVAVGYQTWNSSGNVKGYLAEAYGIDGIAYTPSTFGETKNGVWIPKDASSAVTFGNGGFYLKFESSGDLGNDSSGNNNDFTPSGLAATDQMLDSPTFDGTSNGGNFCVLNPLGQQGGGTESGTCTEGNLLTAAADYGQIATFGLTAAQGGKWYWEAYCPTSSPSGLELGISNDMCNSSTAFGYNDPGSGPGADHIGYYGRDNDGTLHSGITDGTHAVAPYGPDYNSGEIVGIAVDVDNGKIWFSNGEDGTSGNPDWITGDPADGSSPARGSGGSVTTALDFTKTWYPSFGNWSGASRAMHFNFGQDSSFSGTKTGSEGAADGNGYGDFYYNPPSGFVALCAANLTTPAADPADEKGPVNYFANTLWTGDGNSGREMTIAMAKKPSLSVIKQRNSANGWNVWTQAYNSGDYDSFGEFNSTGAWNANQGASGPYTADPTATTLTLTAYGQVNASSDTYVNYKWVANGGTTSTNTEGDIDSTVEVDDDRGISILSWTGTLTGSGVKLIGHGLSAAPAMFITKSTSTTGNWWVFHTGATSWNYGLNLQSTAAQADKSGNGSMSAPTATVFSTNYTDGLGTNGENLIAFCFSNKDGFSRLGSYEGNGNANGTYVYCGFRPTWIMTKSLDSTSDWQIFDNERIGYNVDNNELQANETDAEATTDMIDILSNGFKCRIATDPNVAETYIFAAFAENPLKYATAR